MALTLAVQELGTGRAGHYGQGPGATSQLPTPEAAPPEGVPAAVGRVSVVAEEAPSTPRDSGGRPGRPDHGGGHRPLPPARLRPGAGHRRRPRHDRPRQHLLGLELGLQRPLRPPGRRGAVGRAGARPSWSFSTPGAGQCDGQQGDAEQLAGALLGWSLVVLGPVCLAGVLAAPALARLLTTGTADPAVAAGQQELATFLLRLFIPQVLLYAVGAVSTAVLHAKRHFTVTAVAPIGNTVMMVVCLGTFRVLHGSGSARASTSASASGGRSGRPGRWASPPSWGSRPWRCGGAGSGSGSAYPARPPSPASGGPSGCRAGPACSTPGRRSCWRRRCWSAWASPAASSPTRSPSPASSFPTPSWPCR